MSERSTRSHHPVIALIDELTRLRGRLQSVFAGARAALGLSPMESTVLAAVVHAHAPPTVSQIGRSLGHPRQVIQRSANRLIEKGLVEAVPNPGHKRAPLLRATSAGKKSYRSAEAHGKRAAAALARMLDLDECDRLARELHVLRTRIEAHVREQESRSARRVRSR